MTLWNFLWNYNKLKSNWPPNHRWKKLWIYEEYGGLQEPKKGQEQLECLRICFHKAPLISTKYPTNQKRKGKVSILVIELKFHQKKVKKYSHLEHKMMTICIGWQNLGLDSHMDGKKRWSLDVSFLKIFLFFWKVLIFQ